MTRTPGTAWPIWLMRIAAGMVSGLAVGTAVFFMRAAILGDRLSAWIAWACLTQMIWLCIGVAIGARVARFEMERDRLLGRWTCRR